MPADSNEKQNCSETTDNTGTIYNNDAISSELTSYNPTVAESECLEDELERLKGDAIGNTLYSERFVLNTLLKLGKLCKDLEEDEDLERDLCSVWDMTLEEDVVKYLLSHDAVELFTTIIEVAEDERLTEILVGILANMCNIQQTRNLLAEKNELAKVLLDLTSCGDTLTLEQLMRLLLVVFVKMPEDQIKKWYSLIAKCDRFVENLCSILKNAASDSLILPTLEFLNAILAKFYVFNLSIKDAENDKSLDGINRVSFEKLFVKPEVIECTIIAFKTLIKEKGDKEESYEPAEVPKSIYKARQTFCNIHSILTQFQSLSRDAYKDSDDEILECFKDMLESLPDVNDLHSWQQYEHDVLETLDDVLRVLTTPIDFSILNYLLKLFYDVEEQGKEKHTNSSVKDFESDDENNKIYLQTFYSLLLNTLYYIIFKADKTLLKHHMSTCNRKYCEELLKSFKEPLEAEYTKNCFLKLKEAMGK